MNVSDTFRKECNLVQLGWEGAAERDDNRGGNSRFCDDGKSYAGLWRKNLWKMVQDPRDSAQWEPLHQFPADPEEMASQWAVCGSLVVLPTGGLTWHKNIKIGPHITQAGLTNQVTYVSPPEESQKFHVLQLDHFSLPFTLWGVGILLSTIAIIIELIFYKLN